MNRIIASVGLVALGATSVQAQSSITAAPAKWWNVQATVRGFYDDNLNTVQHPGPHDHVWGYELSPKVGISTGNDQTTFVADYTYAFLYYDHRPIGNTEKYDQDHTFHAALTHRFNERYSVNVQDQFVIGQEPDALRAGAAGALHSPYRAPGDNIVNYGGVAFDADLTPLLGLEIGYENAWYDYKDSGVSVDKGNLGLPADGSPVLAPSLSGALDRIEQTPRLSLLYHVMPDTTASLSYKFQQVNYNGNERIAGFAGAYDMSSIRDNRSHTVYLGVDHKFRPDFFGSVEAGVSYYDYYNQHKTAFGPYARASLTYVYMEESSLQAGYQEGRAATDLIGIAGDEVHDAEDSVVFASVRQRIIPNLFLNLDGTYQHSSFNGGGSEFNDKSENFYQFGANLEFKINQNFSTHVGYDFDDLDSRIGGRSYKRNKVYIGATASY
jgi:hypothetical protein